MKSLFQSNTSIKIEENIKKEKESFFYMKKGLNKSLEDIQDVFEPIKDWEELMELNPDEDSDEENKEPIIFFPKFQKSKTSLYDIPRIPCCYSCCYKLCKKLNSSFGYLLISFISGCIFCLIQLIGIQAGIIILNALFSEIVEECKFLGDDDMIKEYNFYQRIEIASYKSIPEIDVGMFWSFIGLTILKKF